MNEWRFRVVPVEERAAEAPVSRDALRDDPIPQLIYFAFDESGAKDDEQARGLIAIYDALTGSDLAELLPDPTDDPRRLLDGFAEELSNVLYDAVIGGALAFERYEAPWPFPSEDDRKDDPPPEPKPPDDRKKEKFRVRVLDEARLPMAGAIVRITGPGITPMDRVADGGGWVEVSVDAVPDSCDVRWRAKDWPDFRFEQTASLLLADDDDGGEQRLRHLGYDATSLEERVARYQSDFGLETTGDIWDIRADLTQWHDGGKKPIPTGRGQPNQTPSDDDGAATA
ncbi:peptidoglycan-binding domain-containing protein [Pendulispora albinea]|uniref:Peptidoglycan-binding protein n=1 Tax=Pendulispora albinea TaxID=2741071 RepID=A0ABZ2MA35_9BACT